MNRSLLLAGTAALALASTPAPAVGPLVLIAKQIVQGMVKDFIEQRIDQAIRATFGPCKADLAEAAVATRRSLSGAIGGGGVPGLGALGALGGLGTAGAALRAGVPGQGAGLANAGAAAAALQATSGGIPGATAATLGAAAPLSGAGAAVIGAGGGAAMLQTMPGAANALGSMGALGAGGGDMAGAMAMLQQMMSAPPLTDAEFDDVVRRLERFGKVAESIEPGIACSADDYRRMLGTVRVAGGPMSGMGGGMLRLMHTQLLDAERRLAETATMFEQMAPEDRADMVESLATDLRSGPPEGRRATLAMIDAGMLRMPPEMAAALRARLQP